MYNNKFSNFRQFVAIPGKDVRVKHYGYGYDGTLIENHIAVILTIVYLADPTNV